MKTTFYLVQNGPEKAPTYLTEGDLSTRYGRKKEEAFAAVAAEGKTLKVVNFVAGDTVSANVSDLNATNVMGELDAAFRPMGEDIALNAIASIYYTDSKYTNLAAILGGDEDYREFIGERESNKLQAIANLMTTKTYERTWDMDRTVIEDDSSGIFRERIRTFAQESNAAKLRMVIAKYTAMETVTSWIDGQTFLDTDHSYSTYGGYATSQANKSTTALSATEIELDIAKMGALKGFNGNGKANKGPTAILANPINRPLIEVLFGGQFFPTTANVAGMWAQGLIPRENLIFHGSVTAGDVFLIEKRPVAPVILLARSDVPDEFIVKMDPNTSDDAYRLDRASIGERSRFALGYGHWDSVFGILP